MTQLICVASIYFVYIESVYVCQHICCLSNEGDSFTGAYTDECDEGVFTIWTIVFWQSNKQKKFDVVLVSCSSNRSVSLPHQHKYKQHVTHRELDLKLAGSEF